MNARFLADRIGNIDNKLVKEAKNPRPELWRQVAAIVAALAVVIGVVSWLSLRGAPVTANAVDLMAGVRASGNVPTADVTGPGAAAVTDFGLRLLRACGAGEGNTLISPLSVILALGMTANGAEGETLSQMEAVLGMPVEELNVYLRSYLAAISQKEINVANSIWIKNDELLTVRDEFLQTNADYYGAAAYKAPFDGTTVSEVNRWVSENTNGMIEEMLEELDDDTVMLLVNALSFEADWQYVYAKEQVRNKTFTTEDGVTRVVKMMYDDLRAYISDDHAEGFIKTYQGGKYAFAALLPEEGMTVEDYLATLTGESLREMLEGADRTVLGATGLPKFTLDHTVELPDALAALGMTDAFDRYTADFDGMGSYGVDGNLYIGNVLHKTYIEVAEQGTRAGAATVVVMEGESADGIEAVRKDIILDRPFVYMIVDLEANVPLFIGTVMDIG